MTGPGGTVDEADLAKRVEHLEAEVRALRLFEGAPYRAIVEDMTELVVRWKPDGTRTFVNDAYCRLFGTPREEVLGTTFWPLISGEDRERVRARIARLSPEHPVSTGRHRAIGADGHEIWMEWSDRALFDDAWNLAELQSVGRDITERVRLDAELRGLERADAVTRISASVAHDLGNLLTIVAGAWSRGSRDSGKETGGAVEKAIRECMDLVAQLRELRYGPGLHPVEVDLNERLTGGLELLREIAGSRAVLRIRPAAVPCPVVGDPTQIDQVLLNLVRNAVDASPACTLEISTESVGAAGLHDDHRWPDRPPARCHLLRVADDAGGIPAALVPRVFEPGVSARADGQGLGLATVRAIVEAHGGSVRVETGGGGTLFEVALPGAAP